MSDNFLGQEDMEQGFCALVRADALRWNKDLNAVSFLAMFFLQPGFQLSFSLRVQQAVRKLPVIGSLLAKLVWYCTTIMTGCHCSACAEYGAGLYIPHPTGIVIGDGVRIGRQVTIYQGVTIGTQVLGSETYPIVGDSAVVYAGAKIVGGVRIGTGASVGASAVLLIDVPDNGVAVGIPAKIITKK